MGLQQWWWGWQQWLPISLSISLQSEAEISNQSIDPWYWRTGFLLPTLALASYLQAVPWTCTWLPATGLGGGQWVAAAELSAEIGLNYCNLVSKSFHGSCKPFNWLQSSKIYIKQILPGQMLSRYGDEFLVLPTPPSYHNSPVLIHFCLAILLYIYLSILSFLL